MPGPDVSAVTAEQIAYYAARAVEYDAELESRGRYGDSPSGDNAKGWDIDAAQSALDSLVKGGDVLELACGTGWWTRRLAARANAVTAVDASEEMLVINRRRVRSSKVSHVLADVFDWSPTHRYDLVFFAFWLSHIPRQRFNGFWEMVEGALKPGGTVFVVDQQKHSAEAAGEEAVGVDLVRRSVRDGRSFRIVKAYWEIEELRKALEDLGWTARFTCPNGDVFHATAARTAATNG